VGAVVFEDIPVLDENQRNIERPALLNIRWQLPVILEYGVRVGMPLMARVLPLWSPNSGRSICEVFTWVKTAIGLAPRDTDMHHSRLCAILIDCKTAGVGDDLYTEDSIESE
jgi:hypothetical protein